MTHVCKWRAGRLACMLACASFMSCAASMEVGMEDVVLPGSPRLAHAHTRTRMDVEDPSRVFPRPNLYFGTRTMEASPVMTGFAWGSASNSWRELRHACNHDHKLQEWGWKMHDGETYGLQTIGDAALGVNITTEYVLLHAHTHEVTGVPATCRPWTAVISGTSTATNARVGPDEHALLSGFSYVLGEDLSVSTVDVPGDSETASANVRVHMISGARSQGGRFVMMVWAQPKAPMPSRKDVIFHRGAPPASNSTAESWSYTLGEHEHEDKQWDVEAVLQKHLKRSARSAQDRQFREKVRKQAKAKQQSAHGGAAVDADHLRMPVAALNNTITARVNIMVVQHVVPPVFELHWVFFEAECAHAVSPPSEDPGGHWVRVAERYGIGPRSGPRETQLHRDRYQTRLCQTLGICVGASASTREHHVASAALANLVGSTTFFYGRQLLGSLDSAVPARTSEPHGLLTGVPSRSFFPRGFLWDEGFHSLIVSQWDASLSRAVIASWLRTADDSGWIAREQILGPEARSRVPERFQVQRPDIANPPTMFVSTLVNAVDALCTGARHEPSVDADDNSTGQTTAQIGVDGSSHVRVVDDATDRERRRAAFCDRHRVSDQCRYACRNVSNVENDRAKASDAEIEGVWQFIEDAVPRLTRHLSWLMHSQAGPREGTFRWRGATQDHNFASGFDDLPRGVIPTPSDENVDLLAWLAMAAEIIADLTELTGDLEASTILMTKAHAFRQNLARHWNEAEGVFCDIGAQRVAPPPPNSLQNPAANAEDRAEIGLVCHVGYVAIMPLVLRLIDPASPQLPRIVAAMKDKTTLLSPYGLRSLSKSSPYFGTKEDYWRGAVWINMNYLAVSALRYYGAHPSVPLAVADECRGLANTIQQRVIRTIVREYDRTGFIWENYDSRNGRGRGTHPFTGWSALVALLVSNRFPL